MSINWNIIASATSDSASSQAKFNKLIEMHKEDEMKLGKVLVGWSSLPNLPNLRKSFISGIHRLSESDKDSTEREHIKQISFMDLPSYSGNMTYQNNCVGVLQLRDYIQLRLEQANDPEKISYYQECR